MEYDAVVLQSNIYNTMTDTYQMLIKDEYPFLRVDMMALPYGDQRRLGTILESTRDNCPVFIFAFVSKFMGRKEIAESMYSYKALENCLKTINVSYKGKKLASQIFGHNQEKDTVKRTMEMFERFLPDVDVDFYDYKEPTFMEIIMQNKRLREENYEAFRKVMKKTFERTKRIKSQRIISGKINCKNGN
jgi:hypothetical protein